MAVPNAPKNMEFLAASLYGVFWLYQNLNWAMSINILEFWQLDRGAQLALLRRAERSCGR